MNLIELVYYISNNLWGWPFLIFFLSVGVIMFVATYGAPFRFFMRAWRVVLSPAARATSGEGDQMSPIQAFINTLGTSIGNSSLAGIAAGIYAGGPGAIFWLAIAGFLAMALRFAEVYLGTFFVDGSSESKAQGGPMLYLSKVPGGSFLPYLYAFLCFIFSLVTGNAVQANSIALGVEHAWSISVSVSAVVLGLFIAYVLLGGAQRIIHISDRLVPIKVTVFVLAAVIVLGYYITSIIPALILIVKCAFRPVALYGGAVGIGIQQAMRYGLARGAASNEGGLGTAAVFFGSTEGADPSGNAMLSMLGVFISTHVIGLMVSLPIITSGLWNSGLTGAPLTSAAFETVFGSMGGSIITFTAISFGLSVIVSYAYVGRECWMFLVGKRGLSLFMILYGLSTIVGTLVSVKFMWALSDIINGGLLIINLYGLLALTPVVRRGAASLVERYK